MNTKYTEHKIETKYRHYTKRKIMYCMLYNLCFLVKLYTKPKAQLMPTFFKALYNII
jgi:hypothetical protein